MKKIIALALVLILALAVFSSCAKKEETKEPATKSLTYTIYNRTGEVITELVINDTKGTAKMTAANLDVGLSTTVSIDAVVDDTGTPSLQIAYQTAGGKGANVILNEKTEAITLLADSVDFNAPAD